MSFATKIKPNYLQASFAEPEEITGTFPRVDLRKRNADNGGGTVLKSDGTIAYVDDSDNSTITIGSIGSKKTRDVVMPHIVSAAKVGTSMVIHAPKSDILKTLRKYLINQGYRILVFNLREPERGERYNVLYPYALMYKNGNKDAAREGFMNIAIKICEAVESEKDAVWHITASQYLAGLAELLCIIGPAEEVTIENIFNLHLQGNERSVDSTYFEKFFDEYPNERCWKLIYPTVNAPRDTKGSVDFVFSSALGRFVQNDAIVDQTYNSTFKAEDLIAAKTALFLISRDEGSVYDALMSEIVDQLYYTLSDIAEKNGGTLDRKVSFILDEFGNMSALSDIQKKFTLSRARGITWHFVVQSLNQLSLIYGEEIAQIIIDNCNNIVYLYSPDLKLVNHISELCGKRKSEKDLYYQEPLCSVEMLRHLEKGEALMLIGRMRPFFSTLPDISQYYGIEPEKYVDIPLRERQTIKPLDFKKIAVNISGKKHLEFLKKKEEEFKARASKEGEEARKVMSEGSENITSIINGAISDLLEEFEDD